MSKKVSIIQFPGTNCELDTKFAFEKLGFETEIVWHKNQVLENSDIVVIPGGFSYGDYLRSGAIARFSPIMKSVKKFAENGGIVLGICNGFQVLVESHLLPGAMKRNDNLHFISKHHHLRVENNNNQFLSKMDKNEVVNIPIAHAEGNYFIDEVGLKKLKKNNQIVLTYCDSEGNQLNPNGSVEAIAGICNKEKNVFGLMPHPERAVDELLGSSDGIKMLKGFLQN
jgi:phosphoribosylformylglycinamidine synthase